LIAKHIFANLEKVLRRYFPYVIKQFIRLKLKSRGELLQLNEFDKFINSFDQSNIVVAAGGGYIADSFKGQAISVLEMLELASQQRKITGMFGQGLGPIEDKILLDRCKNTFPETKLMSLREKRNGPYLLKNLGVSESNIIQYSGQFSGLGWRKAIHRIECRCK
jgi:polysaccharide pyruvyl transferase WcaK-like protein